MINEISLGRYEFIDPSINSRKFWHIIYDRTSCEYVARWGRIGSTAQITIYKGDDVALKKVKEKLKKGYERVNGYDTSVGSNAIHFIKTLED